MKSCYSILCDVNELASGHQNVHLYCAKVNCRLHWNDKQEDIFEKSDDLRDLPDRNYQTFLFIDYILNYFLFNLLVTQNQYQYLFQRIGFQHIFSGDRWENPIGDSSFARLQAEHGPGTLLRRDSFAGIRNFGHAYGTAEVWESFVWCTWFHLAVASSNSIFLTTNKIIQLWS